MIEHAYIHIPFCIRKCHYCSFVSGKDINEKSVYLKALSKEIKARYKDETLKTVYFGGGTPMLLDAEKLCEILSFFKTSQNCEITIEANPESIDLQKLIKLRKAGFNRISLGIQTFNNDILKLIGRKHEEKTIYSAVEKIKEAGFNNISIDLIYGLPNQTMQIFKEDLEKAIALNVNHISSYGLKIEEESFFGKNPPKNLPDDEMQAEMFLMMCKTLKNNGFEHYEISNFAKQGFKSNHNCAYWKNKNYYGFGLNASGYEGNIRYRNTPDMQEYINNPLKKEEEENLTPQQTMENEIFLALRLKEGIDIELLNRKYGINFKEKYASIIKKFPNLLIIENNHCKLTEDGILLSNNIMSEFID